MLLAEIPEKYPFDVVNVNIPLVMVSLSCHLAGFCYLKHGMTGFRSKLVPQFGDIDAYDTFRVLLLYCY